MCRTLFYSKGVILFGILIILISACSGTIATSTEPSELPISTQKTTSPISIVTEETPNPPTPIQPSSTPAPLAARVNGFEITLLEYQDELVRYQAAVNRDLTPDDKSRVLDDLINQVLLAQAAADEGYIVNESILQQRTDQLISSLGSDQELENWMNTHGYTEQSFQQVLVRSISATWMRDKIISAFPQTAEQIHARQILLPTATEADEVFAQLQAGNGFRNLALAFNPLTGGDLGWFPRGYLLDQGLDDIAFNLQPDEYSQVVETLAGYHIIQVLEREPERVLDPDALLIVKGLALQDWIEKRRSQSDIQILLP